MKPTIDSLYMRKTVTITSDEMCAWLDSQKDSLGKYIANAERIAGQVLESAGIDPNTLFEVVGDPQKGRHVRNTAIDRNALSAETERALDILLCAHDLKTSLQADDVRSAADNAIRLAQHVDRFNTDRAFLKPVAAGIGTSIGGRKGARAVHGTAGSKAQAYREAYIAHRKEHPDESRKDSCIAVAAEFSLARKNGYKTIERNTKGL